MRYQFLGRRLHLVILCISIFSFVSCSGGGLSTAVNSSTPSSPTATLAPTTTLAPTSTPSYFQRWGDVIDAAEAKWQAAHISDYIVTGRVIWQFHEHFFEVKVLDNRVVDSKCTVTYNAPDGPDWCISEFDASAHTVPAMFGVARTYLGNAKFFNREFYTSFEDCFYAAFDLKTGVPTDIRFDCPSANDEEKEWNIEFKVLR